MMPFQAAFPTHTLNVPFNEVDDPKHDGMSLRDYFAGQYLAGVGVAVGNNWSKFDSLAVDCYRVADSMLEARDEH